MLDALLIVYRLAAALVGAAAALRVARDLRRAGEPPARPPAGAV